MKNSSVFDDFEVIFILLIFVSIVLSIAFPIVTIRTFEGTLEDRIVDQGNTFLVLKNISNGKTEVFENEDSLLFWKFNSTDFVKDIKPGVIYHFKVNGLRIPIFSMYRNILSFK
ncbi:hypothetical protein GX656_02505 [Candidatus Dojkabacteria bacterium]|jgi:hypothetical protein|uniref:Uncharacterized protein n=1 Tax=Candidatus Dojkabacteria bacterium TaxID=2099670 RepID=A0A847CZT4_9BACT|nr:hypothetical protein [Candidatus Dojkabacteria bacterium]HNW33021.1 hypothetical protein [Candidatus Dojkabacteria bacterium]